jgi:hypothetical protein
LDVVLNRKRYVNSDVIAIYKEVQIHGPVSLSENVEALVVNPVNRQNIGLVENINKLGDLIYSGWIKYRLFHYKNNK